MKKSFLFLILIAAMCSFDNPRDADKSAMDAAKAKLSDFLQKIPPGKEAAYGFKANETMQNSTVDKPLRTVTFTNEFYSNTPTQQESIVMQDEWRVPVSLNGSYRALLTVNSGEQGYMANAIGAAALASELQGVIKNAGKNEHCYILRIYPLKIDFFVHTAGNSWSAAHYVPLASAKAWLPALAKNNKPQYTLAEVENMVRDGLSKSQR